MKPAALDFFRRRAASTLILVLLVVARCGNSIALAANRKGHHSGRLGAASRALARFCERLYEAEVVRRANE